MTEKQIFKALRATKKNHNFGTAVIFDGRTIQAYPCEDGTFLLASGTYDSEAVDTLPEFKAMSAAGIYALNKTDMGNGLVKCACYVTQEQFIKYLSAADEADWEA